MERETVRRLFMQHYARMYRVARTLLLDGQESEDVCSDIFESLLRGESELVPGTEEQYLLTSVRNRCLKRLRHESVLQDYRQRTTDNSQESEDDRMSDIVEFVTGRLPEREQRIFNLRFTEGYSYEEIALAEGISKVAVWKHLSHAITEVKKHFNPKSL
ncbi:MAG: sigma-70 family RNA polymerase sigma factor [Bacteroidaceae bacterium]|nr:sigma-70 family RNA polymerase sigma factor [Bacteroidaceae bacterium]